MKRIFKIWPALLLCTLALLLLPATAAQAKQKNKGKIGKNATWSYNEKKKVLTISGKGRIKLKDLRSKNVEGEYLWLERDSTFDVPKVNKIVFGEGITEIDHNFLNVKGVKSVSLPASLRKLGYYYSYGDTHALGRVYGSGYGKALSKITIGRGNKKFKVSGGCLLSRNGKTLYKFLPASKRKQYEISDKITKVADNAFDNASRLKKIKIGNNVVSIGAQAFIGDELKEVIFGKKLKKIGESAFCGSELTEIQLPESLEIIEDYAFCRCPLETLSIPSQVKKIGVCAFSDNQKLTKLVIQGNPQIKASAFENVSFYERGEDFITQPITVTLGKNITMDLSVLLGALGRKINIQLEAGNPKYYVKDGNLYTIQGDELVYEREKEDTKTETPPAAPATDSAEQV